MRFAICASGVSAAARHALIQAVAIVSFHTAHAGDEQRDLQLLVARVEARQRHRVDDGSRDGLAPIRLGELRADLRVAHLFVGASPQAIEHRLRSAALAQQRHHRGERAPHLQLGARAVPPVARDRGALRAGERGDRRISER
jgi:hypothetical protein